MRTLGCGYRPQAVGLSVPPHRLGAIRFGFVVFAPLAPASRSGSRSRPPQPARGTLAERLARGLVQRLQQRSGVARDLEVAQRLGHWHTEEDEQLLRDHQVRQAQERRDQALKQMGQQGALVLLAAAWVLPVLWPFAILGGIKAFPRTSRRIGYGVAGASGVGLIFTALLLARLNTAPQPPLPPRDLAPAALAPSDPSDPGTRTGF